MKTQKTAFLQEKSDYKASFWIFLSRHNIWLVAVSIVTAIFLWQWLVSWIKPPVYLLPSPVLVWEKFIKLAADGTLATHTLATFIEVVSGLLIGSLIATIFGYFLAKSSVLEKIMSPYLVAAQAIPIVAIAPLLIIWFGSGQFSKILVCGLTVFFPILVNTMIGFRAVPDNLRDLMVSMKASRWQKLRLLEIPSALPILFGGLRIGSALSVIGAIVGEFVGSDQGLGFLINVGRGQFDTPLVFVSIFILIVMALILYGTAMLAEKKSTRWKNPRR